MEMPKLTKQHKKLEIFAGKWKGDETMHPSPYMPEGGTRAGVTKAKVDLDGFFVNMEYQQKQGSKTTYKGRGILGYDAHKNAYTMNWFDNMGGGADPYTGQWEGKNLVMTSQSPFGHHRCTFSFPKKTSYNFKMDFSADGKEWCTTMEGRYKLADA